jgi:hypothetical protein
MEGIPLPTTQEEAVKIVEISQRFMPIEKLADLYVKLDEEVGKKSENDSLKTSLHMMRALMESKNVTVENKSKFFLYLALWSLVVVHAILVIGMFFAFFILPFQAEWYVAMPLNVFIWFFSTSQVDCKLTRLENYLRQQVGMKTIGGFVGAYFFKPIRNMWKE